MLTCLCFLLPASGPLVIVFLCLFFISLYIPRLPCSVGVDDTNSEVPFRSIVDLVAPVVTGIGTSQFIPQRVPCVCLVSRHFHLAQLEMGN